MSTQPTKVDRIRSGTDTKPTADKSPAGQATAAPWQPLKAIGLVVGTSLTVLLAAGFYLLRQPVTVHDIGTIAAPTAVMRLSDVPEGTSPYDVYRDITRMQGFLDSLEVLGKERMADIYLEKLNATTNDRNEQ